MKQVVLDIQFLEAANFPGKKTSFQLLICTIYFTPDQVNSGGELEKLRYIVANKSWKNDHQ